MFIDASDIIAVNDGHIRGSKWAMENITLGNRATDVLRAAAYLPLSADDDVTMLRLAVRLINSSGAGGAAALSGYYQQAAGQVRDLIEVGFLLDLFRRDQKQINRWRVCGDKARRNNFSPFEVRKALRKLDGGTAIWDRDAAYELYSKHGTHIDPYSVVLMSPDMQTVIGPFPDKARILALGYDLARYLAAGTGFLIDWVNKRSPTPNDALAAFMVSVNAYGEFMELFRKRTTRPDL
jgi:hypothetical protein